MSSGASLASMTAFAPVPLTPSSATSTRVRLAMGATTGTAYQFRVHWCTGTTCGAWAGGPKFTLLPANEGGIAPTAFKGTWATLPVSGAYGGTLKRSSTSAQATIVPAVR